MPRFLCLSTCTIAVFEYLYYRFAGWAMPAAACKGTQSSLIPAALFSKSRHSAAEMVLMARLTSAQHNMLHGGCVSTLQKLGTPLRSHACMAAACLASTTPMHPLHQYTYQQWCWSQHVQAAWLHRTQKCWQSTSTKKSAKGSAQIHIFCEHCHQKRIEINALNCLAGTSQAHDSYDAGLLDRIKQQASAHCKMPCWVLCGSSQISNH